MAAYATESLLLYATTFTTQNFTEIGHLLLS